MAKYGSTAYVGEGPTLAVLDLAGSAAPRRLGQIDLGEAVEDLATDGNHVWAAAGEAGLLVVCVSNPAEPSLVGALRPPGRSVRVELDGDRAYLLGDNLPQAIGSLEDGVAVGWLRVIDVSDPTAPVEVGSFERTRTRRAAETTRAIGMGVTGGFAHAVWTEWGGAHTHILHVIDVADPTAPREVGSCCDDLYVGQSGGVATSANRVLIGTQSGLAVVDVSDPAHPYVAGESAARPVYDVDVEGDVALLAAGYDGLEVVDVASPAAVSPIGSLHLPGFSERVRLFDGSALACDGRGLRVVDLSDPSAPRLQGTWETPGDAGDVAVTGGHAYLATSTGALHVVDVADPSTARDVAHVHLDPLEAHQVVTAGEHAYVVGHTALYSVDVSVPAQPVPLGVAAAAAADYAAAVAVAPPYAFLVSSGWTWGGLQVIDISEPESLLTVSRLETPDNNDVAVQGDHVYLANTALQVVDVSDPTAPVEVASLPEDGISAIALEGGYAYETTFEPDLRVVDISDPTAPAVVGSLSSPSPPGGLAVADGKAYLSGYRDRLEVVDVSDPTSPYELGSTDLPGYGLRVSVADGRVWVPRGPAGVSVLSTCDAAGGELFLPGVAHGQGYNGTLWRSDLEVCNLGRGASTCEVGLLAADQANAMPATHAFTLAPGTCQRFEDAVRNLFATEGAGAFRITWTGGEVIASGRTSNDTDGGTYGSFKMARPISEAPRFGDRAALVHLSQASRLDVGFRTNVGLLNLTRSPLVAHVELHTSGGVLLGTLDRTLAPWEYRQVNRVFAQVTQADVVDGYAVIWTSTPGGRFLPVGSLVDNLTGDGVSVNPEVSNGETQAWLIDVARLPGANDTVWRTSVELCNLATTGRQVELTLLTDGPTSPQPVARDLGPRHCLREDDALLSVFGLDQGAGTARIVADGDGVVASARTANHTPDGTYGSLSHARYRSDALATGERGALIQLSRSTEASEGFRTNLSLVNLVSAPVTVDVELHAAAGERLGALTYALEPSQHLRVNRVFDLVTGDDIADGYAVVSTATEGARFLASAAVVDNRTGDAMWVPVVRLR